MKRKILAVSLLLLVGVTHSQIHPFKRVNSKSFIRVLYGVDKHGNSAAGFATLDPKDGSSVLFFGGKDVYIMDIGTTSHMADAGRWLYGIGGFGNVTIAKSILGTIGPQFWAYRSGKISLNPSTRLGWGYDPSTRRSSFGWQMASSFDWKPWKKTPLQVIATVQFSSWERNFPAAIGIQFLL